MEGNDAGARSDSGADGGGPSLPPGGHVLIVDDEPQVQRLIRRILEQNGFECRVAANADEARGELESSGDGFQLLLCDVNMPGESGIDLIRDIARSHPEMASLMVTGVDDPSLAEIAIELGAYGYLTKPFRPNELMINIVNALHRRRLELENRAHREMLERAVETRTEALESAIGRLRRSEQELRTHQEETIRRLSSAAELRDLETGKHIDRMSRYCALIAERLGLEPERIELIRIASPMHDIGKIGIPDNILLKPASLTAAERSVMQKHTEIGYRILSGSEAELLTLAASLAWTHHERYDGGGYPRAIAGQEIPLEGRIAAVADVFDALTNDRIYRPAYDIEQAIEMMRSERGAHFDPAILDHFLDDLGQVEEIRLSEDPSSPEVDLEV